MGTGGRSWIHSAGARLLSPLALLRRPLGTAAWLLQLRWLAVIGQLITVAVVRWVYGVELPMTRLLLLIGFTAATNVAWGSWLFMTADRSATAEAADSDDARRDRSRLAPLLIMTDLVVLTAMLYLTGGANNPFAFFFFVNLAVAGMILTPPWAWTLTALAVIAYGLLLEYYLPLPELNALAEASAPQLRHEGLFVAFTACASVITYYVTRLSAELTRRQSELREAQRQRDRSLRLEGLATLAAGAAHELASPLATIAVAAREMTRQLSASGAPEQVHADMRLIDAELEHCRQILARMRSAAGDRSAERWDQATVGDLVDAILAGVRDPNRVDIVMTEEAEDQPLWVPLESVAQAVRNLVQNALDASPPGAPVELEATANATRCQMVVRDHGSGMDDSVLHRIGEPFFTTKPPGRGMGLGLFLTRNVVSRLGGRLDVQSRAGEGTTATVILPRQPKQA